MPSGVYNNHKKNSGCFEKGHITWNKGKMGRDSHAWKHGKSGDLEYKREIKVVSENKRRAIKKRCIGSHTFADWETLKAQYNWTCANPECRKQEPEIKLTEDHIIPLIKGRSNNIENIQPLCRSCNSKKHTKIVRYEKYNN
jgi:5-methylcytosine-specific restriction endonuclease McrA